jgi:hypothetical protein
MEKKYLLKLILEWGERRIKENGGRGEFGVIYLIHCKNLCKCHIAPLPSTMK